jgi:hypothetical protein
LSQFFLTYSLSQVYASGRILLSALLNKVLPPVETSGHCIIIMTLNINTPIVNHDNEYLNMEFLPGNFVWDNNSHEKYTNDISAH